MQTILPYEQKLAANPINRFLHRGRHRLAADRIAAFEGRPKVVDIGCATALLFPFARQSRPVDYIGIDPRADFINAANSRYQGQDGFSAFLGYAEDALHLMHGADYVCALECFEHIPRANLLALLPKLAETINCPLLVTVPVEVGPALWVKNVGSFAMGYVRHREYTWPETFWAGLGRLDRVPPHTTHHKGFDWRQLVADMSEHFHVERVTGMPLAQIPAGLNPSVAIELLPRDI
jgi:Methyltransferase domain